MIAFADRYDYLALVNPADRSHSAAVEFSRRSDAQLITTAWIIQELADGLARASLRATFTRLLTAIRADDQTEIVLPDAGLWKAGPSLFAERPDKDWSLTDCISFVVMRERAITDALTGDHNFKQAGFNALLAS